MKLHLYNSMTRKKELFIPLKKNEVSLYVCGVTVYDQCHLGHARAFIAFDLLRRLLDHSGFHVKHIQNFTDIDDKIIERAHRENISYQALTQQYIDIFFKEMDQLNILRASLYPRATHYIQEMKTFIQKLIDKNLAYVSGNDVLFHVKHFKNYGKLSQKKIEDLIAGHRVASRSNKKNPLDFVLWKPAKVGEPSWESPWGPGRPGWHTECVVMILEELGPQIDIHGGGEDLIFPHHDNEIAQCEGLFHVKLSNYWLHNGFVTFKDEKMSKSTQHFYSLAEVLKKYDGEVIRFFLQKVHYRSPLNFSFDGLAEAKSSLERLHNTLLSFPKHRPYDQTYKQKFLTIEADFISALNDDLNISKALAVLFDCQKLVNTIQGGSEHLEKLGNLIGLFQTVTTKKKFPQSVIDLAEKRAIEKNNNNYVASDKIRDQLNALGYGIKDLADSYDLYKL